MTVISCPRNHIKNLHKNANIAIQPMKNNVTFKLFRTFKFYYKKPKVLLFLVS